jgi:hypothetical protein
VEVLEGTITVSTDLILKGTASLGQKINIRDGTGSGSATRGTATADLTTSIWECPITVPLGARRLYAEACYPSNPLYSNVRNLTMTENIAPTIDSVIGTVSGKEIPEASDTDETTVTLSGIAAKGQRIDILDNEVSLNQSVADIASGIWTETIPDLSATLHRIKVEALYDIGQISNTRTFTIKPAPSAENFDDIAPFTLSTGNSQDIDSMIITNVSGSGEVGVYNIDQGFPCKLEKHVLSLRGNLLRIRLAFKARYSKIGFWYLAHNPNYLASVIFFSSSVELDRKTLAGGIANGPSYMSFEGSEIDSIEILGNNNNRTQLDYFSFEI